jgi:lysophospholipase L1-like esterase
MKYCILFLLSVCILAMTTVQKKKKVIFFGDSITEMGVSKGGYIERIGETIKSKGLSPEYELVGAGIGGNKVYDLYLRLENDVLDKKPDLVFIYIGVNDVWHKKSFGTGTDLDKFEKFYLAIIKKIRASGASIILCTPAVIGEKKDGTNEQDKELDIYSEVIRKIAVQEKCSLVDLRKQFMDYYNGYNPDNSSKGILTTDGVHLNDKGNQLVADEMMKAMGL